MLPLDRLFQLHLVSKEDEILRASGHCYGVGQRYLASFIDEEEIKRALPLGPGKKPGSSTNNPSLVSIAGCSGTFDESQPGDARNRVLLIADLDPLELAAAFL